MTHEDIPQTVGGKTYYVEAVCPDYAIPSGSTINAPIGNNYVNATFPSLDGINIFSTWYPTGMSISNWQGTPGLTNSEVGFTDSSNSSSEALTDGNGVYPNDIYPPAITGCTPATSALDGGVTPAANDSWWGWDENDANPQATSPHGSANLGPGYCEPVTPTGASVTMNSADSNCALLIQDLGTNVPQVSVNGVEEAEMPDYYNIITSDAAGDNVVALDPVWDDTTYVDTLTGATIINEDTPGDTPPHAVPPAVAPAEAPEQTSAPTFLNPSATALPISDNTVIPYGYNGSGVAATPFAGSKYVAGSAANLAANNGVATTYYLWI